MTEVYKSFNEVQSKAEIPRDLLVKLRNYNCDQLYETFEKSYVRALDPKASEENKYFYFHRCCEFANLIMNKNGFTTFKQKDALKRKWAMSLNELERMKNILEERYSKRSLAAPISTLSDRKENTDPNPPPPKHSVTVTPRILIEMIKKQQKSVVILDYRRDQGQQISPSFGHLLTIISVHPEIFSRSTGLTYLHLTRELSVGNRPLLARIKNADLVVLMEEKSPKFLNDSQLDPTSNACKLQRAVYEYNMNDKPKLSPVVLDGGFDNFRHVYPTFIVGDYAQKQERIDELDEMIGVYKRNVSSVVYPDLSPKRPPRPNETPSTFVQKETTFDVINSSNSDSSTSISNGTGLHQNNGPRPLLATATPKPYTSNNSFHTNNYSDGSIKAPQLPYGLTDPKRVASSENIPPQPHQLPPNPSIDRSNKPNLPNIPDATPVVKKTVPTVPPPPPVVQKHTGPLNVDRSTKPPRISNEDAGQLLKIYNSMVTNVREYSTRRQCQPGTTGLYNMGNTCFMNALLQALFHTPQLIRLFSKDNFLNLINTNNTFGTRGIITAVFSALMDCMWSGEYSAIKPQRFLQLFANEVNSILADGQQHDASEFQIFLLDALHEDTNKIDRRTSFQQDYRGGKNIRNEAADYIRKSNLFSSSPINDIFNLQTVSELGCLQCREQSATFEDSSLISVELPSIGTSATLQTCLTSHFSQTVLDGDSLWNCPKCKKPQRATRSTKLWSLPPILVIHLKRFSIVHGDYEKNAMDVTFDPSRLDMRPYFHDSAPATSCNYALYAVTNHRGRLSSGHYTAMVSHARTRKWMRMDDETVTSVDSSAISPSDAYILFFHRIE